MADLGCFDQGYVMTLLWHLPNSLTKEGAVWLIGLKSRARRGCLWSAQNRETNCATSKKGPGGQNGQIGLNGLFWACLRGPQMASKWPVLSTVLRPVLDKNSARVSGPSYGRFGRFGPFWALLGGARVHPLGCPGPLYGSKWAVLASKWPIMPLNGPIWGAV